VARVNLYLGYSPSWLPTSDRNTSSPVWLAGLNREQRIIMRSYADDFTHAKPPPTDYPLLTTKIAGAWEDERLLASPAARSGALAAGRFASVSQYSQAAGMDEGAFGRGGAEPADVDCQIAC
jgi:hypothetical protein